MAKITVTRIYNHLDDEYTFLVDNGIHLVHFKDLEGADSYCHLLDKNGNKISDEELFLGHGNKYFVLGEITDKYDDEITGGYIN